MIGTIGKVIEILLSLAQTVAIILALVISIRALRADESRTSAETMLKFAQILDEGVDFGIYLALEHDTHILKKRGGKFTEDDLDKFLGDLELLGEACDKKVIDEDMAYDAFSHEVTKVVQNPEIAAYLTTIRREDPTFFRGIDDLKNSFDDYERRHPN